MKIYRTKVEPSKKGMFLIDEQLSYKIARDKYNDSVLVNVGTKDMYWFRSATKVKSGKRVVDLLLLKGENRKAAISNWRKLVNEQKERERRRNIPKVAEPKQEEVIDRPDTFSITRKYNRLLPFLIMGAMFGGMDSPKGRY